MRLGLLLFACLLLASCASRLSRSTIVFQYADFGPQPMAYKVLGSKNYQWDPLTPIPFGDEPVRVVVYRNIDLAKVKEHYPVDPDRHINHRYISYADAMDYLEEKIRQNLLGRVTKRLEATRDQIRQHLE
jgi:hypothetical protein